MHLIYSANRNKTTTIGNVSETHILYNSVNLSFMLRLILSLFNVRVIAMTLNVLFTYERIVEE